MSWSAFYGHGLILDTPITTLHQTLRTFIRQQLYLSQYLFMNIIYIYIYIYKNNDNSHLNGRAEAPARGTTRAATPGTRARTTSATAIRLHYIIVHYIILHYIMLLQYLIVSIIPCYIRTTSATARGPRLAGERLCTGTRKGETPLESSSECPWEVSSKIRWTSDKPMENTTDT